MREAGADIFEIEIPVIELLEVLVVEGVLKGDKIPV